MIHTIKNGALTLSVNTLGAEMSTLHSGRGPDAGWIWDGNPQGWDRRAPICFPWCGRVKDGQFTEAGATYPAPLHGFVRDMEHTLTEAGSVELSFVAESNSRTLAQWPWAFRFETTYRLEGHTVVTACTAHNTGDCPMPVQIGFHTALRCPFTPTKTPAEYLLRFQREEHPIELLCGADGLLTGAERPRFSGHLTIPLSDQLFDADSICLTGLHSDWIALEERASGKSVRMSIAHAPYVLLWSMPGIPGFLCIEPWSGLPSRQDGDSSLWARPGTVSVAPGRSFSALQRLTLPD